MCRNKRSEQPVAAGNRRLPRTIELTPISLAPLKWLCVRGRKPIAIVEFDQQNLVT